MYIFVNVKKPPFMKNKSENACFYVLKHIILQCQLEII